MSKKFILGLIVIALSVLSLVMYFLLTQREQPFTIEQVKEKHESELMAIDGVVGVGIGECEDKPCIKVLLENDSPDLKARIPTQLEGFRVDTEVTGPIQAQDPNQPSTGSSSNTGTVQPQDPNELGLATYPDLPVTSLPTEPVTVKFVIEHRSALDGKTIMVRGFIVGTLLGEKACPPDAGFCLPPSLLLTDTMEANKNPLYNLIVRVSEDEKESDYPIGKSLILKVSVDGNKSAVSARKIY